MAEMTGPYPNVARAKLPPSYVEAKAALRECAKEFTPERYAIASAALETCLVDDECARWETMDALGSYAKQARDNSLMRLAATVDAMHKEWSAAQ